MKYQKKNIFKLIISFVCVIALFINNQSLVHADGQFSVSPMNQKTILTPGEIYHGSLKITNPANNTTNFSYTAQATPFYVDDNYDPIYENNGDYNQMVNWISIDKPEGVIAPNSTIELYFSINVPENAPAGGQYAAITVTSNDNNSSQENAVNIQAKYSIAHIIYAEIAGTTIRQGETSEINISPFLLSGNITASSTTTNTGNVHGAAKYTLQIFPLFSSEEVFTNEEKPMEKTILPDRTLYNELAWDETPTIVIFNVIYTVEFEGVTTQVSKMVIICPIWLLFIIIFTVFALIFYFIARAKARKKASRKATK